MDTTLRPYNTDINTPRVTLTPASVRVSTPCQRPPPQVGVGRPEPAPCCTKPSDKLPRPPLPLECTFLTLCSTVAAAAVAHGHTRGPECPVELK